MSKPTFVLDRRLVLQTGAATFAGFATAPIARAQSGADAVLFTMSDLHAPYARLPNVLDTIRAMQAEAGAPAAILLNGDIFERGNFVCQRSGGAVDWVFLSALAKEIPIVVNLGNHETAILDDMATFVARADQGGIQVISNLVDHRTDRLGLDGINISLLGLAATNPFVYRPPVCETLTFLDTAQFVADAFEYTSADANLKLIMSYAGVSPDKTFIDTLPAGTVIQGAHDHLNLDLDHNGITYFHGGSWGVQIGMLSLTKGSDGVATRYQTCAVLPAGGDADLAAMGAEQKAEHLHMARPHTPNCRKAGRGILAHKTPSGPSGDHDRVIERPIIREPQIEVLCPALVAILAVPQFDPFDVIGPVEIDLDPRHMFDGRAKEERVTRRYIPLGRYL